MDISLVETSKNTFIFQCRPASTHRSCSDMFRCLVLCSCFLVALRFLSTKRCLFVWYAFGYLENVRFDSAICQTNLGFPKMGAQIQVMDDHFSIEKHGDWWIPHFQEIAGALDRIHRKSQGSPPVHSQDRPLTTWFHPL